jgi:hypothetical protein
LKFTRENTLYIFSLLAFAGLTSGFLFNRVVYSCGLFFAALYVVCTPDWYKVWKEDRYLISFWLLPLTVGGFDLFHSGMMTVTGSFWNKMSLVLLPAFIWLRKPSDQEKTIVNTVFFLMMLVNTVYSLANYLLNQEMIDMLYKQSKVMKVLSFGDHIRMSWFAVVTIWLAVYEASKNSKKWVKYLLGFYILSQVVFLHFLAAKTGLLMLYLTTGIFTIYQIFFYRKYKYLFLIVTITSLPFIAYELIPSFKNRIDYIVWDYTEVKNGRAQKGLSDGSRLYSMEGGVDLFRSKPFSGNGFINTWPTIKAWYKDHKPAMNESDYILPSSEFLIFACGGGIIALIALAYHFLIPLFDKRIWRNWLFLVIYLPTLCTFIYEIHLEAQTAIFVYGFVVFWSYYLVKKDNNSLFDNIQ